MTSPAQEKIHHHHPCACVGLTNPSGIVRLSGLSFRKTWLKLVSLYCSCRALQDLVFFTTSARWILQKDMKQLDELAASALQADLGWRSLSHRHRKPTPSVIPSEVLGLWCGFWKLVFDPKPTCFYFTSNFGSTDFSTDFLLIGRNTDFLSSRHWKQLAWISYPILTLDWVIPM